MIDKLTFVGKLTDQELAKDVIEAIKKFCQTSELLSITVRSDLYRDEHESLEWILGITSMLGRQTFFVRQATPQGPVLFTKE